MDTDGSRRHIENMFISILKMLLFITYKLNLDNVYLISSSKIISIVENRLFNEGFYIDKHCKGVYIIYPILYGERK